MMKMIRRAFLLCLVFTICLTLSLAASAAVSLGEEAGIYGIVGGRSRQDSTDVHGLITTTMVTTNPDNALLRTDVEFKDGTNHLDSATASSDRGVTSFNHTFTIFISITGTPTKAYVAHNVLGGSTAPTGYVYYETTNLTFS